MKFMRKKILMLSALCLIALTASFASLAEEPVERIVLETTADIQIGKACSISDFEFTVLSEGCEVRDAELLNTGEVWGDSDIPRVIVYLRSYGGAFTVKRAGIHVVGAECEYSYYDEDIMRYVIQLRFPSLQGQIGEIAEASWKSSTVAAWSYVGNAAYYEVQLYRDGKRQTSLPHQLTTDCDLGSMLRVEGAYYYRVRAVNLKNENVKSAWKESALLMVDSASAEWNRKNYPLLPGAGPLSAGASPEPYYKDMYGWILEGTRWWYRNADGGYTTDNWQYIDGKWYYFDSRGYMVTGWIDWNGKSYYCDPQSGAMLVNTVVPDGLGLRVDSTGALIE